MVGFAGCFAFQNSNTILPTDNILSRLQRVQALPGIVYNTEVYHTPRFVAIHCLPGINEKGVLHQAHLIDDRFVLFLHGEIRNIHSLRNALPVLLASGSDQAVLLAHYRLKGARFIDDLRGPFTILIFDTLHNELLLFNDHFGSRPLYFYEEAGLLYFGSEKKFVLSLVNTQAQLDPVGLLQVFAHHHNLGSRTFVQNLNSLPPYSMVQASGGTLKVQPVRYFGFSQTQSMRFDEGVLHWSELLRNSVAAGLDGKKRVTLQLSGGLDSRAIACAISRDARPFTSLTRLAPDPLEMQYAEEIAKRLQFDHQVVPSMYTPADYIPAIVWRTECSVSYHHCRSIENPQFLPNLAGHYMGGQFGDISSGSHIRPYMYEPVDPAAFPEKAYQHYVAKKEALRFIFTNNFLSTYLPQLKTSFADSFKTIEEKDNVTAFQVWDQRERQPNFILRSGMVHRHFMEGIYPFLDVDYFRFVTSVPDTWRKGQLMYRAVIHHLGPEIRHIPNANDNLKLRGSLFANRLEQWAGSKKAKMQKRFGISNKPAKTPHRFANDEASVHLIENFLKSPYFDPAIFNRAGIEALLKSGARTTSIQDRMLQTLATFAIGLPLFIYNPVTECPEAAVPCLSKPSAKSNLVL